MIDRQSAIEQLRMMPDRARALVMEQARRKATREAIFGTLSAKQREAVACIYSGTYTAICAGRRSGKTYLDERLVAYELEQCARDEWVVFLAPTGQVGKELIWTGLEALNENFRLGWDMREHPVPTITTRAGGRFKIVGCDNKSELGKLRGKKYRLVIIDEAKELANHLRELVDEIFRPAFMGVGGRIVISGTPGRICDESDYWYAICFELVNGWKSITDWTIRQNPWFKDPEGELRKVRAEKNWHQDNAIYLREYEGQWASDTDERCYPYLPTRNSIAGLPDGYDRDTWYHVLGIDYGYSPDPCAWVVWASHPNKRDMYCVHAEKEAELLPDTIARRTASLVERYKPSAVVGDGAAKILIEDFNRRYAEGLKTHIRPADKLGKRDHMEILGQEIRAPGGADDKGKILLCLPMAEDLGQEWLNLGWKDDRREVEKPGQPNHCADAALYGFLEAYAYLHQAEKPAPAPEEAELEARRARQKRAAQGARGNVFGGKRR